MISWNPINYVIAGIGIKCELCSLEKPEYYMVSDWEQVVPLEHQDKHLCWACYTMFRAKKGLVSLNYWDYDIHFIKGVQDED